MIAASPIAVSVIPSAVIDALYVLCVALLLCGALYLVSREWIQQRRQTYRLKNSPKSPLPERPPNGSDVRWFVGTSMALLVWVVTLFLFGRSSDPTFVLWVGRANFAAVSLAVWFGYRFVRALAGLFPARVDPALAWVSAAIAALSAFTPLVDAAERTIVLLGVGSVVHETAYGPLFGLYLVHAVGLVAASVWLAFTQWRSRRRSKAIGDQLFLVGAGILATGAVTLTTNAILPYAFGDFRFIDAGPLSTLLFLLAVGYAILRHRLFDIRIFLRMTVLSAAALYLALACCNTLLPIAVDRLASSEWVQVAQWRGILIAVLFQLFRYLIDYLERAIEVRRSEKTSQPVRDRLGK